MAENVKGHLDRFKYASRYRAPMRTANSPGRVGVLHRLERGLAPGFRYMGPCPAGCWLARPAFADSGPSSVRDVLVPPRPPGSGFDTKRIGPCSIWARCYSVAS